MEKEVLKSKELQSTQTDEVLTQDELSEIFGLSEKSDVVAYDDYGWDD